MSNTITARANKYDIDKLLDFEESLPNPKHCMSLITDAMTYYNQQVYNYHHTPTERKPILAAIISWGLGETEDDGEDEHVYPNKTYSSEYEFCKAVKNNEIFVEDQRDLLDLFYRTQDLFKVVNIAQCAKLGDRVVYGSLNNLRALKKVVSHPDIYINLYDDNDIYFDEDY